MKYIILSCGTKSIVDNEDFEKINQWKWQLSSKGYAHKNKPKLYGKRGKLLLHHIVMKPPSGMVIDHINGNTLDNRKSNLRICTISQNLRNKKIGKNNTTGYKGIYWNKKNLKWQTNIGVNGKSIHIGVYQNKIDAARAYNKASVKYFGEFARLNVL